MSQLSTRRQYAPEFPLLKNDLDAFVDDIETFVNVIKLNNDNIQDDGITASTKISDGTLTGTTLNNLAITTAKIADGAITTAKFADEAVTTAKILDDNVTTAKLADTTVSTANIADASVTGAKLESALKTTSFIDISSSSTAQNISSYSVIGSLGTITTQGGPVLMLGQSGSFEMDPSTTIYYLIVDILIERAVSGSGTYSTVFQTRYTQYLNGITFYNTLDWKLPVNVIKHLDTPAAGTWDYRVKAKAFYQSEFDSSLTAGTQNLTTTSGARIYLKELI